MISLLWLNNGPGLEMVSLIRQSGQGFVMVDNNGGEISFFEQLLEKVKKNDRPF